MIRDRVHSLPRPNPSISSCSIKEHMRRAFSLLLILFFGLGPVAVALPGDQETRLPACCRRDGAHHCAMSGETSAGFRRISSETPAFAAPSHCPSFPGQGHASTTSIHALAMQASPLALRVSQSRISVPRDSAEEDSAVRLHAGRGPPLSVLS